MLATGLEPDEVRAIDLEFGRVLDEHHAVVQGRNAASAFSRVVLPVLVPPLIRMFSFFAIASRTAASTSGVIVPIRTSSSAVKKRV